jgi:Uncharacterized protein conserved in bacteria (DUF2314)
MATAYPDFHRDGFFLHNGVELAKLFPATYEIPSTELRYGLKEGALVKLAFRFEAPGAVEKDYDTERMWVTVRERFGDHWIGELDNDPRFNSAVSAGHRFHFHPDHVIDIWSGE